MFEVTEKFTKEQNLINHYNKHVIRNKEFGDITQEEYEYLADDLQRKPVDYKNILGYIGEYKGNIAYCKYDKTTGIFVAYNYFGSEPRITCFIRDWRTYNANKAIDYIDEIPKGK